MTTKHPSSTPRPGANTARVPCVLVVDDNTDSVESLAEVLGDLGYEAVTALDGRSALAAAATSKPNLSLIDVGLPDFDGYELARRLLASGTLPEGARLVALTGRGDRIDRERAAEAGFHAHILKPLRLETLERLLRDLAG